MSDWLPDAADTRSLGSASREWLNVYVGDAGRIYFGLAQDVSLYRSAAGTVRLGGALLVDNFVYLFNYLRVGDVDYNVYVDYASPAINFGDRSSVWDVNLYRSAADLLRTDDTFQAAGYKSSDGTAGVTGTINLAAVTTITVKNGLITAWS